jgi:NADH-quinone oxidoreductase subunit H
MTSAMVLSLAGLVLVLIIILTFAPVLVWADRRQSAMIQDRIGPIRAGIRIGGKNIALWGLLHPLADALKFMWKEDFIPPRADKLLHALAPIISVIPAIAAFGVIPFSAPVFVDHAFVSGVSMDQGLLVWVAQTFPQLPATVEGAGRVVQVASLNIGILFVFAVGGTGVVGAALAGYCSDNKYALLGGLRAASQMVSYEVTLGLSLVGCFMIYDTLLLEQMVQWQIDHHLWGIFLQPFAFILFLTASIAEAKRVPFDVPEGESELAAGYFTEYSGMKFGMFMMGEYIETVVTSALMTVLFLGGYDCPFVFPDGLRLELLGYKLVDGTLPLPHLGLVLLSILVFILKVVALCFLQLQIRWSLPRFRYDQIMKMCWLYMLPISLANVFITGMVLLLIGG